MKMPLVSLHDHIEGTVTREMAERKAGEHGMVLPAHVLSPDGKSYQWRDFGHLVTEVYDCVAHTIRTKRDYEDITYDHLTRYAAEGCIYNELIIWSSQARAVGLPYAEMVDGIAQGIDRAQKDTGIIARMNTSLVRFQPMEKVWEEARAIASCDHPYIVGLDLAGNEQAGDVMQFLPVFEYIHENSKRSLGNRMHFAENAGPQNGWDALKLWDELEKRFGPFPHKPRGGHTVRCSEDMELMAELKNRQIFSELCPPSNILAGIYPSYQAHPLPEFLKQGVQCCLNSDDPGLFGCSIGQVYQICQKEFSLEDRDLLSMTKMGINAAFVDQGMKQILLAKVRDFENVSLDSPKGLYSDPRMG